MPPVYRAVRALIKVQNLRTSRLLKLKWPLSRWPAWISFNEWHIDLILQQNVPVRFHIVIHNGFVGNISHSRDRCTWIRGLCGHNILLGLENNDETELQNTRSRSGWKCWSSTGPLSALALGSLKEWDIELGVLLTLGFHFHNLNCTQVAVDTNAPYVSCNLGGD